MSWPQRALGAVATIDRIGVPPESIKPGVLYVGLENIERGGSFSGVAPTRFGQIASTKFRFDSRHVLFGKLRPNLAKIARPNFEGICSTDILPIRPSPLLDRGYLAHFLALPQIVSLAASRATGVNLPRLSPKELQNFKLPLPPIEEQRRIANILDRADDLRAKRREALACLDDLAQSIFFDMFGDFSGQGIRWISVGELLKLPLRNGISPATAGRIQGRVLTLSAVTGSEFDATASKTVNFARTPGVGQEVNCVDLLICRGNGNLALVGRGMFPTIDMRDTAFPDTVIAAQFGNDRIDRDYLEYVWNSRSVRRQIESMARTTNGTFKVNQAMIENLKLPDPGTSVQRAFGQQIRRIRTERKSQRAQLSTFDDLFASLQQRAFAGQL